MNRNALLGEITGIAGDVFKALEAKGFEFRQRDVLAFNSAFCKAWMALPEPDKGAKALADAVLTDEKQHGGLLGRETIRLANVVKKG